MGSGSRPWLRDDASERLFTLRLKGVTNPLDPDPLWESTYGGGSSIYDLSSTSSSRRLKEALNAHRKLSPEWDDFGFPIEKMQVFSDVVMWLPEKMWDSSSREGGGRLFMLSEKLKYRHRTDFGEELYKEREPNYAIMPLKDLAPDEVVFQFGLGVYLPHKEDKRSAEVKLVQSGQKSIALPNWIFFENQREIERPACLYEQQHFLLLASTLAESAIQSPSWFSLPQGYFMMDTHRDPNRIYGDGEFVETGDITAAGDISYCEFYALDKHGKAMDEKLKLLIHRLEQATDKEPSKPQNSDFGETIIPTQSHYSNDPLSGLTVISAEEQPVYRFRLSVTGIILPSIDYPRIKYWRLHLNAQGDPAANDEESRWIIRGNAKVLEWCELNSEAESQQWQGLDTSLALPFPEDAPLQCRPAVLEDKQHAILNLPHAFSFPLSHQLSRLGRDSKNEIALQLLNHNDSVEWLRATRRKQTMGHLGLSAQHLAVSLEGQGLLVQQQSTSAATHILQDNVIIQTLEANSFAEAKLSSSQELMVGNYLLQYTKEVIEDEKV